MITARTFLIGTAAALTLVATDGARLARASLAIDSKVNRSVAMGQALVDRLRRARLTFEPAG